MQLELREWLNERHWTHFVTLAFNDPNAGLFKVRRRLRDWDARINRRVAGPRWLDRPDMRLHWCAFPEKLQPNPHWHLCLQVLPEQVERLNLHHLSDSGFALTVETEWKKLVPSGSVDVQSYEDSGAADYSTKSLLHEATLENFVHSLEFIR